MKCHTVSRPVARGIRENSPDHRILLALRAPGGLTQEQLYARVPSPSHALARLADLGLINKPKPGKKGETIQLTREGRELIDPSGPLSRRKTEFVFCEL